MKAGEQIKVNGDRGMGTYEVFTIRREKEVEAREFELTGTEEEIWTVEVITDWNGDRGDRREVMITGPVGGTPDQFNVDPFLTK